tara:strand:- start:1726 stop:1944 length:219 start_codon:yes stop_codon:yes gene_type:complete
MDKSLFQLSLHLHSHTLTAVTAEPFSSPTEAPLADTQAMPVPTGGNLIIIARMVSRVLMLDVDGHAHASTPP